MTSRTIFPETRHALRGATILACIFLSMPFLEEYPFLFALKFGAIAFCSAFVGFLALFHSYFITVSADRITFFQFFLPLGIFKKSEIKSMKMLPFAKLQIVEKRRRKARIFRTAFRRKRNPRVNPRFRAKVAFGNYRQKRRSPQDRAFSVSGNPRPISKQPISKAPPRRTRTSAQAACLCLSARP